MNGFSQLISLDVPSFSCILTADEQGHQSTLACILANMSMKLGQELKWDAASGKIIGDEQAQAMLQGKYREPWQHPALKYA